MGLSDTSWDVCSGNAVECAKPKEAVVSARGMTIPEFDEFLCLFGTGLELQGWKKTFLGYNLKGDLEVRFKLIEE